MTWFGWLLIFVMVISLIIRDVKDLSQGQLISSGVFTIGWVVGILVVGTGHL